MITANKQAILLTTAFVSQIPICEANDNFVSVDENRYIFSNSKNYIETKSVEQKIYPEAYIEKWTSKHEKRFDELLILVHTGRATDTEREEMSMLRTVRRKLKYQRTADEIMSQMKKEAAQRKLKQALMEYVEVVGENKEVKKSV